MLKIIILSTLHLSLFSLTVRAETSSKCPGEEGYTYINYRNRPNPSNGGFVSYHAYVDDSYRVFIAPTASVCGDSKIEGEAKIYGNAVIRSASVSGRADISGSARIEDGAEVTDNARINGSALISGSVRISGKAFVGEDASVINYSDNQFAEVLGDARLTGSAKVSGNSIVGGRSRVMDNAVVSGSTVLEGNVVVRGFKSLKSGTYKEGNLSEEEPQDQVLAREQEKKAAQKAEALKSIIDGLNSSATSLNMGDGGLTLSYSSSNVCSLTMTYSNGVRVEFDFTKPMQVAVPSHMRNKIEIEESQGIWVYKSNGKRIRDRVYLFFYSDQPASNLNYYLNQMISLCNQ